MADYGSPPYKESAFKSALRLLAAGASGAGYGAQAPNAGEAFGGAFNRQYAFETAATRAAQDYALKQQENQRRQEDSEWNRKMDEARLKQMEKPEPPPKPEKIDPWDMTPEQQAARLKWERDLKLATTLDKPDTSQDQSTALSDEALNIAADMYLNSGLMPAMGMGKNAANYRAQILDRAAKRSPGANIAANKAGLSAGTKSLGVLQQTHNSAMAWANTVDKNADVMMEALKGMPETGTRFGNKVARWTASQLGDPNVARFNAARETVKVEFARLLQSPGVANTMLSDSARKEVEHILAGDYTKKQLIAALSTLKRDSRNRLEAYSAQVDQIRSLIAPQDSGGGADLIYNPATGQLEPER